MKKIALIITALILGVTGVFVARSLNAAGKANIALRTCVKQEKVKYRKALSWCNRRWSHAFKRFKCRMETYRTARKKIRGCDFVYGEPPGKRRRCERRAKEEFRRRIKNCGFLRVEKQEPCRRNLWSIHRRRMKDCAKTR